MTRLVQFHHTKTTRQPGSDRVGDPGSVRRRLHLALLCWSFGEWRRSGGACTRTILDLPLPVRDQCLCRLFCGKIRKRQMEACLALGSRRFCPDAPVHPRHSKPVSPHISISRSHHIRRSRPPGIRSAGTLGTVHRADNIPARKGDCLAGRTSHWVSDQETWENLPGE